MGQKEKNIPSPMSVAKFYDAPNFDFVLRQWPLLFLFGAAIFSLAKEPRTCFWDGSLLMAMIVGPAKDDFNTNKVHHFHGHRAQHDAQFQPPPRPRRSILSMTMAWQDPAAGRGKWPAPIARYVLLYGVLLMDFVWIRCTHGDAHARPLLSVFRHVQPQWATQVTPVIDPVPLGVVIPVQCCTDNTALY